MLVLTRHQNEQIVIGEDIVITIVRAGSAAVRVGIEAPRHVNIVRGELLASPRPADAPQEETHAA